MFMASKSDNNNTIRCKWLTKSPIYIKYHDEEWGTVTKDSERLFEMLCLEGQQSGLSWITILNKRNFYREAFYNFNPWVICEMTQGDVERFLKEGNLLKHKQKLTSIIDNAKSYVLMESNGENFSEFIWSFVGNEPIVNMFKIQEDVPVKTKVSEEMAKELKKRNFRHVGPTVCYAFMQACGLVNDHTLDCFCHPLNKI